MNRLLGAVKSAGDHNFFPGELYRLLLVVELCFALGKLLIVLLPRFHTKLMLVGSELLTLPKPNFAVVMPDIPPPLPLRI